MLGEFGVPYLEFRAEFFNLVNHVNFANPISNFNAVLSSSINPNTGQITSAVMDVRWQAITA